MQSSSSEKPSSNHGDKERSTGEDESYIPHGHQVTKSATSHDRRHKQSSNCAASSLSNQSGEHLDTQTSEIGVANESRSDGRLSEVSETSMHKTKSKKGSAGVVSDTRYTSDQISEMTVRATAVNSKKLDLHQQALVLMQLKLDEWEKNKDDHQQQWDYLFELIKETQNTIAQSQQKISMHEAHIARLEQRLIVSEQESSNGVLLWEIKNYTQQKQNAVNGQPSSIYSRTFKSSQFGYHMCGRLYLNGDGLGKGTHMSIFFAVRKGTHDAILPWPFKQRVTFKLLNQAGKPSIEDSFFPDPSSVSFKKPTKEMNVAAGCPKFAQLSHIENPLSGFLVQDTLMVLVKIDTTDLEF